MTGLSEKRAMNIMVRKVRTPQSSVLCNTKAMMHFERNEKSTESATENIPPIHFGKGEMAR